jgi:hypothetical protein
MYVFLSYRMNGHEVSWFNATGVKNSSKDELFRIVEPQNNSFDGTPVTAAEQISPASSKSCNAVTEPTGVQPPAVGDYHGWQAQGG